MLIALEGIDGSGKTTQAKLLAEHLGCRVQKFPAYHTKIGQEIMLILQGESQASATELQALMTVNRYEFFPLLRSHEQNVGDLLVLDRYTMSGIAYGHADGLQLSWLKLLNSALPEAQTIYIDVTVEESLRRRPERSDAYESSLLRLREARQIYLQNAPHENVVDGMGEIDVVQSRVQEVVDRLIYG